jgi:hypothetical protein
MTDTTNMTNIIDTTDITTEVIAEETPETSIVEIPRITWDSIRKTRDDLLLAIEGKYRFDMPQELLKQFQDYKQALRDLPETYKDLEDLNQIEWPVSPMLYQNLVLSR